MKELKTYIQFQSFKLVGVELYPSEPSIQKVLQPGWFPFGHYPQPDYDNYDKIVRLANNQRDNVYQISNSLPRISVSCIVGKNGSGKSSLLDVVYRILNNLAYKVVDSIHPPKESNITFTTGLFATLYFVEGVSLMRIECKDSDVFYEVLRKNDWLRYTIEELPISRRRSLFYTIGVNYGLYAFNKSEYVKTDGSSDGDWVHGVFHKNDGYLAPLALVPFRDNGVIRLQTENDLANQRIAVMSILAVAKRKSFPEGYRAVTLSYKFDPTYVSRKKKELLEDYPEVTRGVSTELLIDPLTNAWRGIVESILHPNLSKDIMEAGCFYLAYKTIKICLIYSDYRDALKLDQFDDDAKEHFTDNLVSVVNRIWESRQDHITLKIHQCLQMFKESRIKMEDDIQILHFVEKYRLNSYDDVMKELPPAFFKKDIYFERIRSRSKMQEENSSWETLKKSGFKLSTMSSGERQFLNLISYICYHIKNIQSIDVSSKYRIPYRFINVILDEAELYFHPDMQRRFISMLIESMKWANINRVRIPGINFIIVTHSPFLLTDVFTENTLYLKDGKAYTVKKQSFGGNYYEILNNSFFFDKDPVGDISAAFIRSAVKEKIEEGKIDDTVFSMIGDPYVRAFLQQQNGRSNQDV